MDLKEIRKNLDKLDAQLVAIIAERMRFIPEVAKYKQENNIKRYQPQREKQIIKEKRELAKKYDLNPDLIEDIIQRIIKDAHRIEKKIMKK
ncbi:MAG: hypothetical protein GF347_05335 [Candidatus Moranbacteria bacterium]|nr:hypothetical protein [Candidatus Moranbacteria bacterium]